MSKVEQTTQSAGVYSACLQVGFGVLALFATAQICIPLGPVPMTLQTFAMLIIGLTYQPREAGMTTGLWFFLGALGVPLWAGYTGGLPTLLGPTGGFLMGMGLAPIVMSWLLARFETKGWMALSLCTVVGQILLFACGVGYLSLLVGCTQAVAWGLMPFMGWNLCKGIVAVLCARFGRIRNQTAL